MSSSLERLSASIKNIRPETSADSLAPGKNLDKEYKAANEEAKKLSIERLNVLNRFFAGIGGKEFDVGAQQLITLPEIEKLAAQAKSLGEDLDKKLADTLEKFKRAEAWWAAN